MQRGRGLCPEPTAHQLAVQLTGSEDKDLLVCVSKIFRTLPRESSYFLFFLFFKIIWEKPEVVYLKIVVWNFKVNVFRACFSGGWPVLPYQ